MENEMDDLKAIWKTAKGQTKQSDVSAASLIQQAESKKRQALLAHYSTIAILTLLVIMLGCCVYFFFPFQDLLSRAGVVLMIGGVTIRVGIEIYSISKSNKVNVSDTTARAVEDTVAFHQFRKKIHGPVTLIIVLLYIIGFYMLSPEFSRYISFSMLAIFDAGFLVGAVVLAWAIRKGMMKELEDLGDIIEIQKQLT